MRKYYHLVVLSVFFALVCFSCSKKTVEILTSNGSFELQPLNSNAKNAQIINPVKSPYLYYEFSLDLLTEIKKTINSGDSLSFEVTCKEILQKKASNTNVIDKSPTVTVAFLYNSDFSGDRLINSLPARNVAQGSVSSKDSLSLSFMIPKKDVGNIRGFLIKSETAIDICSFQIVKSALGWKFSKENRWFGFSFLGGSYENIFYSSDVDIPLIIDLSEQDLLKSNNGIPYITVFFRNNKEDVGKLGEQNSVSFTTGNKSYSIRRAPNQESAFFYPSRIDKNGDSITLVRNAQMVTGVVFAYDSTREIKIVFANEGDVSFIEPIITDPGLIIDWSKDLWRNKDYELFQWKEFPSILIFDFSNYSTQDDMLKRLAFFVEKEGFRGRLATDNEIKELHGFNAHDYRAESLASFFTLATKENFKLNKKEIELQNILIQHKIIIPTGYKADNITPTGFKAGVGAIISISQESNRGLRQLLLTHESFHGIYFMSPEFRNLVKEQYVSMDSKSLEFLKGFFASQPTLGYDPEDEYLMENELMAYLMQQSVPNTQGYFAKNLAVRKSVNDAIPELAEYVRNTNAQGFINVANVLEQFVFDNYGLAAGRVSLVFEREL